LEFRNEKSRQFPLCCVKALGLLESEEEALSLVQFEWYRGLARLKQLRRAFLAIGELKAEKNSSFMNEFFEGFEFLTEMSKQQRSCELRISAGLRK